MVASAPAPAKSAPNRSPRSTPAPPPCLAHHIARHQSSNWSLRFVKVCASSSTCLKGMRWRLATVAPARSGRCLRFADHPSRRIRHVWLVQCQVRRVRRERTLLEDPVLFPGEPGTYRLPELTEGVDTYCWAHNETSTGVAAPIRRVAGSREAWCLDRHRRHQRSRRFACGHQPDRRLLLLTAEGLRCRWRSVGRHPLPPKLSIVRQASNQALIWKAHIAGCRRSSR